MSIIKTIQANSYSGTFATGNAEDTPEILINGNFSADHQKTPIRVNGVASHGETAICNFEVMPSGPGSFTYNYNNISDIDGFMAAIPIIQQAIEDLTEELVA